MILMIRQQLLAEEESKEVNNNVVGMVMDGLIFYLIRCKGYVTITTNNNYG